MMSEAAKQHDPAAADRARRRRNLAIAVTLALMVMSFYVATFVRFGNAIASKTL